MKTLLSLLAAALLLPACSQVPTPPRPDHGIVYRPHNAEETAYFCRVFADCAAIELHREWFGQPEGKPSEWSRRIGPGAELDSLLARLRAEEHWYAPYCATPTFVNPSYESRVRFLDAQGKELHLESGIGLEICCKGADGRAVSLFELLPFPERPITPTTVQ